MLSGRERKVAKEIKDGKFVTLEELLPTANLNAPDVVKSVKGKAKRESA